MTDRISSLTVPALRKELETLLEQGGVSFPKSESSELLSALPGVGRTGMLRQELPVSAQDREKLIAMARQRIQGRPLQYILGSWSFMGREYCVGEGVLIPRDDTEVMVGEALRLMKPVCRPVIVDLCAGSGIIAVTLSQELKDAEVFAVEKSPEAYPYLVKNIEQNRSKVKPILADLSDCVGEFADGSLDLIASNPPYVRSGEIAGLQKEIGFEPRMALDGGEDGFVFYEQIISLWTKKLKAGGYFVFEIGEGQYETVASLLEENGCTGITGYPDIQGITRAVTARRMSGDQREKLG